MHRNHQDGSYLIHSLTFYARACAVLFVLVACNIVTGVNAWTDQQSALLREETEDIFYHGYENYMKLAFPEDELRPLSCTPLTRDRADPSHVEVNDALGNYSLTLIDTLSTLAIFASSPTGTGPNKPLLLFQDGIKSFVEQYGDGTSGPTGQGLRARGFDLDSKVQLFETAIRGLGGLLSAHLFAVGELPIRGYTPGVAQAAWAQEWRKEDVDGGRGIQWSNGLVYDGQLLRLAYDLGQRLLPAFWTPTGIPYPRINLRDGIPFYANSPYNYNPNEGQCDAKHGYTEEVTENCSAGAGSLVLEFTVLSRLTGDPRFEELAKRAFWSIWARRSDIDLIGAGIDAETGLWVHSYTGIGASIDSFFEYAFKSSVLLSSEVHPNYSYVSYEVDPRDLFEPLSTYEQSSSAFLQAWETAHAAIKRHILRGSNFQHPHYIQVDLATGAARAFWMDSLSAFYPGLLTLSGHTEEAIETHLVTTALWSRFSALPERWNLVTGGIEGGLGWWPGRPEFIESNYYLYRATEDPWYKYVAEMTLRDIKRTCWAKCGWAGIQNVLTGEQTDRMESFFLGETAKYLFLTFNDDHPLNHLDAPFVFSTEGHPLIIPRSVGNRRRKPRDSAPKYESGTSTCPVRPSNMPFSISSTAARGDVYHAAALVRLHQVPKREQVESILGEYAVDHASVSIADISSPSNFTYFPWTLPVELIPKNAMSTAMRTQPTFDLSFPSMPNNGLPSPPLQRVKEGILVNFLGGLRLGMIQDVPTVLEDRLLDGYRIYSINSVYLGKDEKVFLPRDSGFGGVNPADPVFTRIRDTSILDLVVDTSLTDESHTRNTSHVQVTTHSHDTATISESTMKAAWNSLVSQISNLVQESQLPIRFAHPNSPKPEQKPQRVYLQAMIPTGKGAAPIPDWPEPPTPRPAGPTDLSLAWTSVYATDQLCDRRLAASIPRQNQVIVVKRGGCSFSEKLANIPVYAPTSQSLQLVIVVSYGSEEDPNDSEDSLIRPLLDQLQTTISGLPRQSPLPMVMVGGGEKTYQALKHADGIGVKRRYTVRTQGVPITNLVIT